MKFSLNFFKANSNNDIFKNMGVLALGVGGAQVISFALTPIITRIYSPEDFGILAVFMAAVGVVGPFTTLRYSVPLPLLKNNRLAINLFILTILILCMVTLVTTISLTFYGEFIFDLFSINSLISYWWLLPIAIFGSGFYEIMNSWSIRQKNFKAISKTNVFQTMSSALMKIAFGLLEMKSMGLILGNILSSIIAAILLLIHNSKSIIFNIKYVTKKRMKFLLYHYIEYPKYRLPSQFILVLTRQAPLFFLAAFFGSDVVGYFGLTMMTLSVPFSLFGNTTGQAYYAEIAKIGRKNPQLIYEVTVDVIKKLFLFSLIPFVVLLIASPWLFSIVFGEKWQDAGIYASIMSVYILTAFISAPLANALSVFENQLMFLRLNVIRLGLLVILFFIAWISNFSSVETIFIYSIGMSFYFVYLSYFILKVIKNNIKEN